MSNTPKLFEVVTRIWSNHYQKYFEPGETIDLSFATDADIAAVVKTGAIKPATEQVAQEEDGE